MIETVIGIEVLQANPILDNAFGLRWVKSHQTQLGFEKRKESHRSDNRFPECISRFRRSLAIEMPTKSDASFCHSVLPDLPSGSFAPTGLQTLDIAGCSARLRRLLPVHDNHLNTRNAPRQIVSHLL
jgi:hypothetical protein